MTTSPATPALPDALTERFQKIRLLGEGNFGQVLLVRDRELNRPAALKLLASKLDDPNLLARFEREARLASELEHPHLLRVFDHGTDHQGQAYLLTEYVGGETLQQRLERAAPSRKEVTRWGLEVAGALQVLHEAGIVHRDVKPSNVLLREDGAAVLADLGLARHDDSTRLTAEGLLMGTPLYLAPELWEGAVPAPAADQFAWAACLHRLTYGRDAYPSPSPQEILALMRLGFSPVKGKPEDAPRGLERAVARGLQRDPAARFPDLAAMARELAADPGGDLPLPDATRRLERATAEPEDGARPTRISARGRTTSRIVLPKAVRAQRRQRKFFLGLTLVLLITVAVLFLALVRRGQSPLLERPVLPDRPPPPSPVARAQELADATQALAEAARLYASREITSPPPVSAPAVDRREHLAAIHGYLTDARFPLFWRRFLYAAETYATAREAAGPWDYDPEDPFVDHGIRVAASVTQDLQALDSSASQLSAPDRWFIPIEEFPEFRARVQGVVADVRGATSSWVRAYLDLTPAPPPLMGAFLAQVGVFADPRQTGAIARLMVGVLEAQGGEALDRQIFPATMRIVDTLTLGRFEREPGDREAHLQNDEAVVDLSLRTCQWFLRRHPRGRPASAATLARYLMKVQLRLPDRSSELDATVDAYLTRLEAEHEALTKDQAEEVVGAFEDVLAARGRRIYERRPDLEKALERVRLLVGRLYARYLPEATKEGGAAGP